jgi:hypothetical protein
MLKFAEIGSKKRTDWLTCALKYTPRSLGYQKFRFHYQLSVLDRVNMLKVVHFSMHVTDNAVCISCCHARA